MIIGDNNSDEFVSQNSYLSRRLSLNTPMRALYEGLRYVNGFTRGPNGKVKFHKDTEKRRREEMSEDGVDKADTALEERASKSKKRNEVKVGQQFQRFVELRHLFEKKRD